ncbi:MAG: hypothetical protein WBQ86_08200 [Candidatus Binatus sp.]
MKLFVIMACAGLLLAGVIGSSHRAYAQDADEIDQNAGAWSGPDAGSDYESNSKTKVHPLDIKGCWSGNVVDTGDGVGTATFDFDQNSNHKKLVLRGSDFDFEWTDSAFVRAPMKGSVTSTGFKFTTKVVDQGKVCTVSASGMGDDTELMGTVEFGGYCATMSLFQNVTFSITPGCS